MEETSGLTVMHKPLLFVNAPSFRESSSRNIIVSPGEKLQFLSFVKHKKRSRKLFVTIIGTFEPIFSLF
jgi:hypothetical protein